MIKNSIQELSEDAAKSALDKRSALSLTDFKATRHVNTLQFTLFLYAQTNLRIASLNKSVNEICPWKQISSPQAEWLLNNIDYILKLCSYNSNGQGTISLNGVRGLEFIIKGRSITFILCPKNVLRPAWWKKSTLYSNLVPLRRGNDLQPRDAALFSFEAQEFHHKSSERLSDLCAARNEHQTCRSTRKICRQPPYRSEGRHRVLSETNGRPNCLYKWWDARWLVYKNVQMWKCN